MNQWNNTSSEHPRKLVEVALAPKCFGYPGCDMMDQLTFIYLFSLFGAPFVAHQYAAKLVVKSSPLPRLLTVGLQEPGFNVWLLPQLGKIDIHTWSIVHRGQGFVERLVTVLWSLGLATLPKSLPTNYQKRVAKLQNIKHLFTKNLNHLVSLVQEFLEQHDGKL